MPHDQAPLSPDDLFAELRRLCDDVAADADARARRLAVLRRLERRLGSSDRPSALLVA